MCAAEGGSITRCEWCGVEFDSEPAPETPAVLVPPPQEEIATEREARTHCEWCGAPYPQPKRVGDSGDAVTCRILVVCVHNSARSQMAEELIRRRCGDGCHVESAGLEPGVLNPVVVSVLSEIGIDIRGKSTRSVFDVLDRGTAFDTVITVCDEANAERCPAFPGATTRLHWGLPDPSGLVGSDDEKLAAVRVIRDEIADRVDVWCRRSECCTAASLPE